MQPLKLSPIIMKTLMESHPREFDEIFKLLKAADAVLEKSDLFQEFGKAGAKESRAEGQICAKARGLVAKDGDLTFEEAVEKVMDGEPELYERAEQERHERIARMGNRWRQLRMPTRPTCWQARICLASSIILRS